MSWVAVAIGGSAVIGGVAKAVTGNQTKQRNKGYIEDAYRSASQRQTVHENDVRQDSAESLNARGLLVPGQQFTQRSPSSALTETAYAGGTPSTLGGQMQADTNRELGLERHDLDAAHTRAQNENNAAYMNDLVGAATGTAQGIMSAYGAHENVSAMGALDAKSSPSVSAPAPSQMLSGGEDEMPMIQGAFGLHPLTAKPQGTQTGLGQMNATFHVG